MNAVFLLNTYKKCSTATFLLTLALAFSACGKSTFFNGGAEDKKSEPQITIEDSNTSNSGDGNSSSDDNIVFSEDPGPVPGQENKVDDDTADNDDDDKDKDDNDASELVGIKIPYDVINLKVGESILIPVTATYSDNSTKEVTAGASFTPADATIIAVSDEDTGEISGLTEDQVDLTIKYEDQELTVPVNVLPYAIVALRISPAHSTIRSGEEVQYQIMGTTASGDEVDVTTYVSWESSDAKSVVLEQARPGLAKSLKAGQTMVSAHFSDLTASASLQALGLPTLVVEKLENTQISSETQIGRNEITLRITNLRAGDSVTPSFNVHSVDFKPEYVMGQKVTTANAGWFDQIIVLNLAHKHLPEATRYMGQKQSFAITFEDSSNYTINHDFAIKVVKTDAAGNVKQDEPTAIFTGTEGHPGAVPAEFPE